MKFKRHFYFAPDEGGEGGGVDLSQRLNPDPEPTRTQAKYESQLSKEFQNDDFKGIESLDDLYKGYRGLAEKEKTALHIPTAESSDEEVREFFTKIGMPEKMEDYNLKDYDQPAEEVKDLKSNFMKEAFKNGLTRGQANNLWKQQLATYAGYKAEAAAAVKNAKDNFDSNYDKVLQAQYPDSAKRAERMTFEQNLFKEFSEETGLGDILAKTGITLNPEALHKFAVYHEAHGAKAGTNGSGGAGGGNHPMSAQEAMINIYNRNGK